MALGFRMYVEADSGLRHAAGEGFPEFERSMDLLPEVVAKPMGLTSPSPDALKAFAQRYAHLFVPRPERPPEPPDPQMRLDLDHDERKSGGS